MEMFEIALTKSLVRQTRTKAPWKSLPVRRVHSRRGKKQNPDNWRVYQVRKHSMSFLAPHSSFVIRESKGKPDRNGEGVK